MNGDEKITVTMFGDHSFQVNPEWEWQKLLAQTFADQMEFISEVPHWVVQLHRVDLPVKTRESFLARYQAPAAENARKSAIHGLCWANYEPERDLLNEAFRLHEQMLDDMASDARKITLGEHMNAFGYVGMQFAEMVFKMDHKALKRMAAIIENRGTPASDKPRGGEDSDAGQMYREFTLFHVNTRSLPTKKQLRNACGIGDFVEDLKRAGKLMKSLGLDGLPESKSH